MALKLVQYPNGRHRNVNEICQRKTDHPAGFEPLFDCGEKDCTTCRALSMGHDLINKCYIAQHKENDSRTVQGEIHLIFPESSKIFEQCFQLY